jgi:hypothetical protein
MLPATLPDLTDRAEQSAKRRRVLLRVLVEQGSRAPERVLQHRLFVRRHHVALVAVDDAEQSVHQLWIA